MGERIGQILVAMGVLNDGQVEQILDHQRLSRQRFGQIAVAWGWATPQDVWEAWARQLTTEERSVDLDELGFDTAAIEKVPPAVARHYRVVAIRAWGRNLVLAVSPHAAELARLELPSLLDADLHFCLVTDQQVQEYVDKAYAFQPS